MGRDNPINPRKKPVQDRSKAMVQALLDATARILVQDGYDTLSTNKVAHAAGVSVGSLYQYYPSKEALVRAVLERWGTETTAQMVQLRGALVDASLDVAVAAMVHATLESARRDPRLSRAMLEQLPRIGAFDAVEQLNRRFAELLASWLDLHPGEAEVDDNALAAQVVVTALDALCAQAVTYRPELFESPRFTEHVERLVLGYLAPTRAAARFGVVKPARAKVPSVKVGKAERVSRGAAPGEKAPVRKVSRAGAPGKKAQAPRTSASRARG